MTHSRQRKSLRGALKSYAMPELIEQEDDAWATLAGEQYEISRLSEPSLAKVWDNEDDAAYDSLEIDPSGNGPASTES